MLICSICWVPNCWSLPSPSPAAHGPAGYRPGTGSRCAARVPWWDPAGFPWSASWISIRCGLGSAPTSCGRLDRHGFLPGQVSPGVLAFRSMVSRLRGVDDAVDDVVGERGSFGVAVLADGSAVVALPGDVAMDRVGAEVDPNFDLVDGGVEL